jgi:hypothetical protein
MPLTSGFRNVPNQYEPLRPNRFEVRFPAQDIELHKYTWIVNAIDRPKMKVNSVPIKYLNYEQKVAGHVTFDDIQLEFIDLQGPSSAQLLLEWYRLCAENLTGRMGYASGYKKDLQLIALDPTLVGVQQFTIFGAFISNIDFGKNEYTSDEVQKISVTLSYDLAENNY